MTFPTLERIIAKNISQSRFNLITILWLTFLTVLTGWWMYHDYIGVKERNDKLMQIYTKSIEQQKRYDLILKKQEEELGISGKTK
jgi:hypothetical protein